MDFSTREAIIVNLPQRIGDVLTRPYPWQLGNTSQQLGLLGTIFAFTCFWLLAVELWRARGHIMEQGGAAGLRRLLPPDRVLALGRQRRDGVPLPDARRRPGDLPAGRAQGAADPAGAGAGAGPGSRQGAARPSRASPAPRRTDLAVGELP